MYDISFPPAADQFRLDDRTPADRIQYFLDLAQLVSQKTGDGRLADLFAAAIDDLLTYEETAGIETADGTAQAQIGFLAGFLTQLQTSVGAFNRHADSHHRLYLTEGLRLTPFPAQPDRIALRFRLKPDTPAQLIPERAAVAAGQDQQGVPRTYRLDNQVMVNSGEVIEFGWLAPHSGQLARRVVMSAARRREWPNGGVRLFDMRTEAEPVQYGVIVEARDLKMSSGNRHITVQFAGTDDGSPIELWLSSRAGWLPLLAEAASHGHDKALPRAKSFTRTYHLAPECPPVEALDGVSSHQARFPLLKASRPDGTALPAILSITCRIAAPALLYRDGADVTSPSLKSYPFDVNPVSGVAIRVASPDWFNRAGPVNIALKPNWIGLPLDGFPTLYADYDTKVVNNDFFKVRIGIAAGSDTIQPPATSSIFEKGTGLPRPATLNVTLPRGLPGEFDAQGRLEDQPSWLRVELGPVDFLHSEYLRSFPSKPNLQGPYLPQTEGIEIEYSFTIDSESFDRVHRFGPYGPSIDDALDNRPTCLMGISDCGDNRDLSIYWRLVGESLLDIRWLYLAEDNCWKDLPTFLLDETRSLSESGRLFCTLPSDAMVGTMPGFGAAYWLRGVAMASTPTGPWIEGVLTNCVTATLDTIEGVPDHLGEPLPANSATRLVEPRDGLAGLEQPWPSTGGCAAATDGQFLVGARARLKARQRAVRPGDLTLLLRRRFPEVSDYQIERHIDDDRSVVVTVFAYPFGRFTPDGDPQRPVFPKVYLDGIRDHLKERCAAWTEVRVENPKYREYTLVYDAVFSSGVSAQLGHALLLEAVRARFNPWTLDPLAPVEAAPTIRLYELAALLTAQPVVDALCAISLYLDDARVYDVLPEPGEIPMFAIRAANQTSDEEGNGHAFR